MSHSPNGDQERLDAEILARHLPEGYSAGPEAIEPPNAAASAPDLTATELESSLKLLGGDIHRDLFRADARGRIPPRAATFHNPAPRSSSVPTSIHDGGSADLLVHTGFTAREQLAPGGFRRQFIARKHGRFENLPVTRNFVEFLDLYGSFAGEDLADSDDEDDDDESGFDGDDEQSVQRVNERRPLLGSRRSTTRSMKRQGDASNVKSFFTLLKAFIGTGIMFLPKAFNNGGILFSSITLLLVAVISCIAFHLLLQCRKRYGGGYGELGEEIGGPRFRTLILASITISQIGFVCAGIIFVAENLYAFLEAVISGPKPLSITWLIGLQMIFLIPLALIRNISKLGPAALLADIFILIGLVYIWWFDIKSLAAHGIHPTVRLFNPNQYTLTVGAAIFTFEGIGLILPIQSSMKHPEQFGKLLYIVMFIITVIYTSVGALCYATFGSTTQTEIISNFPQSSKLVNAVQFLYSLAVLIGDPVQLFPPMRIIEGKIFGRRSGKRDGWTKWKKNALRTGLVLLCWAISVFGASDLDKFVALIGSFACVPLVYIYPALLHYKGVASSRWVKAGDIALMVVGVVAMVYTTLVTSWNWTQS